MNTERPTQLQAQMTLQETRLALMSPAPTKKAWRRRGIEVETIQVKVWGMMRTEGCNWMQRNTQLGLHRV